MFDIYTYFYPIVIILSFIGKSLLVKHALGAKTVVVGLVLFTKFYPNDYNIEVGAFIIFGYAYLCGHPM